MRQRVLLAPRNAGEAVAVAVSAVLLAGSAVAIAHQQVTELSTVNASSQAEAREADVRTISRPGPSLQEISVDGSRLPHVPVFVSEAPEVLANVVNRYASPRTGDRSSNPMASSPLLGALGQPQEVTTPTGVSMAQEYPVAPTPTSSPTSSPTEEPPTTEPTTEPTPTETPTPTDPPTTPPETTPPTTEPEPDPDPDPSPDTSPSADPAPDGDAGVAGDPAPATDPGDPGEPAPQAHDGSSEPEPEADGPQSTEV